MALKMMSMVGCDNKALYKAVEVTGEGVKHLEIADRLTICNMIAEMGAKNGIIAPDEKTEAYLKDIIDDEIEMIESDEDANYDEVFEIDLSTLEPIVAVPHSMDNIKNASELSDVKFNHVFIGSCTNGRLEDIAVVAKILKGKKIADDLRLIVVPASQKIYKEALKLGYIETIVVYCLQMRWQ